MRSSSIRKGKITCFARRDAPRQRLGYRFGCRDLAPGCPTRRVKHHQRSQFGYRVEPGHEWSCLATVSNQPVAKPLRPEPDEQQRHSCFNDPGRGFPSDADLRRRKFPSQQRYKAYVTAIVANETNGGTRIQKRGSCRGEPLRKKAFAFHPFDRRCDSSDCATEDSCYVYLYSLVAVSNQPVLQPDPRSVIKCH